MAEKSGRVTVRVEELALSNSVTLAALVELLEERKLVSRAEVLERVTRIQVSGSRLTM